PMTGSYHDYPKNLPLVTPFGEVEIAVTDGDHVHVDFSRPERPLVVRGQYVWGGLHLWRQPDGSFGPDGRAHGSFVDRFDPHTHGKSVCRTTHEKLLTALVGGVSTWARENGTFFEAAERGRKEANMRALREEIARLEDELAQRRDELTA